MNSRYLLLKIIKRQVLLMAVGACISLLLFQSALDPNFFSIIQYAKEEDTNTGSFRMLFAAILIYIGGATSVAMAITLMFNLFKKDSLDLFLKKNLQIICDQTIGVLSSMIGFLLLFY